MLHKRRSRSLANVRLESLLQLITCTFEVIFTNSQYLSRKKRKYSNEEGGDRKHIKLSATRHYISGEELAPSEGGKSRIDTLYHIKR